MTVSYCSIVTNIWAPHLLCPWYNYLNFIFKHCIFCITYNQNKITRVLWMNKTLCSCGCSSNSEAAAKRASIPSFIPDTAEDKSCRLTPTHPVLITWDVCFLLLNIPHDHIVLDELNLLLHIVDVLSGIWSLARTITKWYIMIWRATT